MIAKPKKTKIEPRLRFERPAKWNSYRSYAFAEDGMVKINLWPKAVMKIRIVA
jgi:hypothetical protein